MKKTTTILLTLFLLAAVAFTTYWALGFKRNNNPVAQTNQEKISKDSTNQKQDTNKDESHNESQQLSEQNEVNDSTNETNLIFTGKTNSKKLKTKGKR
ncbi:hypothetical protein PL321_06470 [Caloramator sp. mosi_1]|uniref:hypothetical protein n=1 Tax=Caloramator sp. mosi_1 TaxID=3023090 RepID=UPI002361797D|nr:hypothetical protein [Caloramator sp. mosi_1]WDC85131.1 hypothetical protein PL321_06470 [Caloramator sp. mosi_1]